MNDLQSKLAAFYRDCEQRLAVCEAEGQSLFQAWCGNAYEWDALTDLEQQRWNRFSAPRNQRPAEIRALVALAKALEATIAEDIAAAIELRMIVGDYEAPPSKLEAALLEILADWRAAK